MTVNIVSFMVTMKSSTLIYVSDFKEIIENAIKECPEIDDDKYSIEEIFPARPNKVSIHKQIDERTIIRSIELIENICILEMKDNIDHNVYKEPYISTRSFLK